MDEQLLYITGMLNIGAPGTFNFDGAWRAAREHDLPHEVLSADEVGRRYPACRLPGEMQALYEPLGGFLLPERCIVAARGSRLFAAGAEVHGQEAVITWQPDGDGVQVTTTRDTYYADRLVLTAGAWVGKLLAALRLPLRVERQVLGLVPAGGAGAIPGRSPARAGPGGRGGLRLRHSRVRACPASRSANTIIGARS